ncbi:MAG: hypothetical protein FIB04_03700 [Gammaproteobacteria bacterium]|nr:hypothetical protein [Gammaproteobacteria bacterium]
MRSSTSCAEVRRRLAAACVAAAACFAGRASAAATDAEAFPAWDGWSRPGRVTEIAVRMVGQERRAVGVRIDSGGATVRTTLALEPGQPSVTFVPVRAAETVSVRATGSRRDGLARDLRLALSESPLLAWVAPPSAGPPVAGFHTIAFEAQQLPHTASAYSSIDALVIERGRLPALAQEQFAALLSYVAGCGRTVLVGASTEDAALFRAAVGCGGQAFAAVASPDEAGVALERMLSATLVRPPDAASLSAIPGPDLRAWHLVVTLLVLCAAVVVIGGIFTTSLAVATFVPATLAACLVAFVQTRAPDEQLTVWAESGSGDRLAQYHGLQQAVALGRGVLEVPVLAALARPQSCRSEDPAAWQWDANGRRFSSVRFEGRLFSRASVCYAGEFPVARSVAARPAPDGSIVIANRGASSSPPGLLAWGGRLFRLGALQPGASVAVETSGGNPAQDGAQGMALERTPLDAPAVLWPLELSRVTDAPQQSQAWLLMRASTEGQG